VCRKPLSDNGLAVTQELGSGETESGSFIVSVLTTLMHESGEWKRSRLDIVVLQDKNGAITPQAIGSASSYARRYSLAGMVGVYQEDNDSEGAMQRGVAQKKPTPKRRAASKSAPKKETPTPESEHTDAERSLAVDLANELDGITDGLGIADWRLRIRRQKETGKLTKKYYDGLVEKCDEHVATLEP
jgi:hypothetical protein